MKSVSKFSRIDLLALGLGCAWALSAVAEEPNSTVSPASVATVDPQRLDRDGKPIYGFELMTQTEVSGLRSLLFSIKDPVAREEARVAHRKAMDKRAQERGVKLQE